MSNQKVTKIDENHLHAVITIADLDAQSDRKNAGALTDLISTINKANKKKGKELDKALQVAACLTSIAAHKFGQWKLCNDTVNSLSAGGRKNAMRAFLEMYAPVKWAEKKKEFVHAKSKRICIDTERGDDEFENSELFQKMINDVWTRHSPEPAYRGINPAIELFRLTKRMIERLTSGKEEDLVSPDQCLHMIKTAEIMGATSDQIDDLNALLEKAKEELSKVETAVSGSEESQPEETSN